ncbi:MAG: T9SS type A sorting domain-containing protein, partial [Bacteroidota bacterium]
VSLAGAFTVETGTPSRAETTLDLIPEVFVLHEAYPNPFNPATKIRYAIPEGARVKLEIYNMLGNVVAALVEGEKQKGYYEITWVAENQPSGVYLVRMQAEGLESQKRFIGSRKVVLVK